MARNKDFNGSLTALLTPFRDDGTVDLAALERFIDWQIDQGTAGLIPAGTTGESPTLTHDEHALVVAHTVKISGGRVPVMAGAGSNSTHEAIGMARHAKAVGADALLVVAPYYNKPTQEGSTGTSCLSPMRRICRSTFIMFPGVRSWKFCPKPWRVSRSTPISSEPRMPQPICRVRFSFDSSWETSLHIADGR